MKQKKTDFFRRLSIQCFDLVAGGHNFHALLEFDVTNLRSSLRKRRLKGEGGSLLAFFLKAIGQVMGEMPLFNSMVDYRQTTTFDQVDVNIPVEIDNDGTLQPKQFILRDINSKSLKAVTEEIALSKENQDGQKSYVFSPVLLGVLKLLPRFLTQVLFRLSLRSHRMVRDLSGTVFITSVTMFTNAPGFIIPYSGGPKAVSFALGSLYRKPLAVGDRVEVREVISLTAIFNHDLIDGAPAARFINRLRQVVEKQPDSLR